MLHEVLHIHLIPLGLTPPPLPPTIPCTHPHTQLSVGRLHSVIITIKIPSIQSCRKVKVSLDETVGELMRYDFYFQCSFTQPWHHPLTHSHTLSLSLSLSLPLTPSLLPSLLPLPQHFDASCSRPRQCPLEPHGAIPSLQRAQTAWNLDGRLQIPSCIQAQTNCKSQQ